MHELIHTLGFWHEHSRPDRDEHITVNWDNIEAEERGEYNKTELSRVNLIGPYDVCSIMHYSDTQALRGHVLVFSSIGK